jgi:hypothetical protein
MWHTQALVQEGGGHEIATTCTGDRTNLYDLWSERHNRLQMLTLRPAYD